MKHSERNEADFGLTGIEKQVMRRLLRMKPEQQKAAPKPTGARAEAQRRRREKERRHPVMPSCGA